MNDEAHIKESFYMHIYMFMYILSRKDNSSILGVTKRSWQRSRVPKPQNFCETTLPVENKNDTQREQLEHQWREIRFLHLADG